jgi:hypothetical protein
MVRELYRKARKSFEVTPALLGFLFGADGTSLLGPDAENKKQGRR